MVAAQTHKQPPAIEQLLTADEVAVILRVSRRTLINWTTSGQLPKHKLGGRLLYSPADVRAFIEACKVQS
jgi:excisionase family DNA binding protein